MLMITTEMTIPRQVPLCCKANNGGDADDNDYNNGKDEQDDDNGDMAWLLEVMKLMVTTVEMTMVTMTMTMAMALTMIMMTWHHKAGCPTLQSQR